MCGIFGVVVGEKTDLSPSAFRRSVGRLFELSESRGKESAGLALLNGGPIQVYKQPIAASALVRSRPYRRLLSAAVPDGRGAGPRAIGGPLALIGHSRLVTNGAEEHHCNNQPVIASGLVGIHNGIIVNDRELWAAHPELVRRCEVDTEILLGLIRRELDGGAGVQDAARAAFAAIEGAASVAILFQELDVLLLATNNGALYLSANPDARACLFASEEYILRQVLLAEELRPVFGGRPIENLRAGSAALVRLSDGAIERFALRGPDPEGDRADGNGASVHERTEPRAIVDLSTEPGWKIEAPKVQAYSFVSRGGSDDTSLLFDGLDRIDAIRRCRRCILPETFPDLTFDAEGVCSLCRGHRPFTVEGEEALRRAVEPHRRQDGRPDCLVGISGGRDSCYGLHYVKNVLGLNPIAYTYDWGMVTDLARRNISRMCGKLGIEHILVSADINRKRSYIRKNVSAWLRRPDLGMIPLFMAGDKQFYYYMNKLRGQTGIDFMLFCAGNEFEQTRFKTGFSGVGASSGGILTSLPLAGQVKLAAYYAGQAARNPAYLNSSIPDTLFAYFCSYMMSHEYVYLYHYLRWDEKTVMQTLLDDYGWELASDTVATWRIGDGTASFYNYIYYRVAGFTEMDTFRSNQIREGMIARDEALEIVRQENRPRYESIKWYLSVIGLETPFNDVIATINAIPKLYE